MTRQNRKRENMGRTNAWATPLALVALAVAMAWPAGSLRASSGISLGMESRAAASAHASLEAPDTILLRSGRTLKGEVLEETDTVVTFRLVSHGISSIATYDKVDIVKIERGAKAAEEATEDFDSADSTGADPARLPRMGRDPGTTPRARPGGVDEDVVYVMNLEGYFGWDITQTPIRDMVRDAEKHQPDYLVVVMDCTWRQRGAFEDLADDEAAAFDQLFRAEDMEPIFTKEIPQHWDKPPQIVFWVKKAMGGAAFLPLIGEDIYFHSEGKLGGIGNLSTMMGSRGDEVVRDKQISLRMGHAEGMAIQGGHDPKLIKAMARAEYVLSYRIEGGEPVLLERMPESEDEFLLTDDGGINGLGEEDTIQELARSQGNDVLTIDARVARDLKLSKGTVDSLDDLLYEMGIARTSRVVEGRAEYIQSQWNRGLENATIELPRMWREYQEIGAGGDERDRARARGQRTRMLKRIQGVLRKYEESIPNGNAVGVPSIEDINLILEQIKIEQMQDQGD